MTHQPLIKAPTMDHTPSPKQERYIENLFSSIANRYDLINSVLSLGRHKAWRRYAVSLTGLKPGDSALDVCCGTGDFALELARAVGSTGTVKAVDFSGPMLQVARRKAVRTGFPQIEFVKADALNLPFGDNLFHCATVGFGLRNISNLDQAISEIARVVKPNGKVISLEIFGIRSRWLVPFWRLYFNVLGPGIARLLQGDRDAYHYLPRSVDCFATPQQLAKRFEAAGLDDVRWHSLALGAVCVHVGNKK